MIPITLGIVTAYIYVQLAFYLPRNYHKLDKIIELLEKLNDNQN